MSTPASIAHYRITSKLGEGGMGAVYRATDTKLGRDVAVKILPAVFASDPDRLARFTREAQLLASLNHPNIAAIYGVEEGALIMELIEGENLKGPVPVAAALDCARQIVAALEAAHEKGIIHRDLKPANIKITPDGVVKLLDFGLAKATEAPAVTSGSPTISPTMSLAMTQTGVILGTAAYMSPEQARGKPVDRRADIWAFGVVLYELLTGRHLFGGGETVTDTIASVVTKEPDWSALPPDTPAHIRRLLERCLRKDAKTRLQAIGEARILIDEPLPAATEQAPQSKPAPARRRRWLYPIVAGVPSLIAIAALALLWQATHPPDRPMMRFSVDLGTDATAGIRTTVAISPDGTRIVFPVRSPGGIQLATRLLDQPKATTLSGTEGAADPFFSPDGQWIGFFADSKLKKISIQGGAAIALCDAPNPYGAAWGDDGSILVTLDLRNLFRVSAGGGTPQLVAKAEGKAMFTYRWPQILPGDDRVLVTTASTPADYDNADIAVLSLKNHSVKVIQRGGYFGRYLPSGHLIYIHQGTLFGAVFDLRRLEIRGTPVPLIEEVAGNTTYGGGQFDVSRTGALVYLSGKAGSGARTVVWMDAAGKQDPLTTTAGATFNPRLSPDGTRLALALNADIYVYDLRRGALTRVTFNPSAAHRNPVWTPDGKHLVYAPVNGDIWWTRADGSSQPQRILDGKNISPWPTSFSPDARQLAFTQIGGDSTRDIWILPLDTTDPDHPKAGKPELFLQTPRVDTDAAFSYDGRWLAYASEESGVYHVYVRPSPAGGAGAGKWQISTTPGRFPIWSRNGREMFYETLDGRIMVVDYTAKADSFSPGTPRQWCATPILLTGVIQNFDLAPDGKRFVVLPSTVGGGDKTSLHVTFLLNFFDELKRRLPTSK